MRSEFVKLTPFGTDDEVFVAVHRVACVYAAGKKTIICFAGTNPDSDGTLWVKESPAEVLALLAGEGKADGIWDVVKKLRFVRDDAALRKAAAAATEITLVMRFDQLDRLVAYFDGRKTDA